jgi:hypothetical protein
MERLFDPESLELAADDDGDGDGGIDAIEALGRLYVATDRLVHAPDAVVAQAELEEAADALAGLTLPYGFEPQVWDRIGELTTRLVDALDLEPAGAIEEHAMRLRDLLRQYV